MERQEQIDDVIGGLSLDLVILTHPMLTEQDRIATIKRMARQIVKLEKLVGKSTQTVTEAP